MNTSIIVWLLLAKAHSVFMIPSIEFSSKSKCEQAIATIHKELEKQNTFLNTKTLVATCVRIEK